MKMKIQAFKDAKSYYQKVHPFLVRNEAENNLALGLLNQIIDGRYQNPFLALAMLEEEVVAGFLMTPPHNLIIFVRPEYKQNHDELAEKLFQFLMENETFVPGLIGEKETVKEFSQIWERMTGKKSSTAMRQRIYRLDKVNKVNISEGIMRKANEHDIELVSNWIRGFIEDTGESTLPPEQAKQRAEEMIENEKSIYLWEVNGNPVSMARSARKTDNGITINLVYTPNEFRKEGYGTSVVATLSRKLLEAYDFCALYTDLDYPTSNKIYMEIGYVPVCDSTLIKFEQE
ncbi:GNAT family N-acetyltransferase [Rossellomorea sp. BNER]|uniref:GNAT family N-acetyltransferase n=1 Tax=Rossellomorea sp. BNER TaxID=2962031 RepID=UPI003AF2E988|nr:GNAT family N-acetyltransferase [Rossellomorea sp. BNER]